MPYLHTRIKNSDWRERFAVGMYPPPIEKRHTTTQAEYKYERTIPPAQVDCVLAGMRTTIEEFQTRSTETAKLYIQVYNLTMSPPLWPLNTASESITTKMYAFKLPRTGFPRAIPVKVAQRSRSVLAPERIMLRVDGEWRPLPQQLVAWAREYRRFWTVAEKRDAWWKNCRRLKGSFFPWDRLPAELKGLILRYALGNYMYPMERHDEVGLYISDDILVHSRFTYSMLDNSDVSPSPSGVYCKSNGPSPEPSVLRVRNLQAMALRWGWTRTTKFFNSRYRLAEVVRCPNPPPYHGWLSDIYLDMDMRDYLSMFGVCLDPRVRIFTSNKPCIAEVLRRIDGLKTLALHFEDPHHQDTDDLWQEWNRMWPRQGPCWKTLVDWILTFAFPYIKHVPRVRLRGCIKTTVKTKWDRILELEYANRKLPPTQQSDHGFEYASAVATIEAYPESALPPKCYCPQSCLGKKGESGRGPPEFDHNDEWQPQEAYSAGSNIRYNFWDYHSEDSWDGEAR